MIHGNSRDLLQTPGAHGSGRAGKAVCRPAVPVLIARSDGRFQKPRQTAKVILEGAQDANEILARQIRRELSSDLRVDCVHASPFASYGYAVNACRMLKL